MEIVVNILVVIGTVLLFGIGLGPVWAWIFAHANFCFTFIDGGEGVSVLRGSEPVNFLVGSRDEIVLKTAKAAEQYNEANGGHKKGTGDKQEAVQWDIVPEGKEKVSQGNPFLNHLKAWFECLGARWFGLSPFYRLATWDQTWMSPKTDPDGNTVLEHKNVSVQSFFTKHFVFGHRLKSVETGSGRIVKVDECPIPEMVPVDLDYLLSVRIINPFKSLYRIHRYLDATLERSGPAARKYVGQNTFAGIVQEKNDPDNNKGFEENLKQIEEFIRANYGLEFVSAEIANVGPGSEQAKEILQASIAAYIATEKGRATEAEAKAAANAIRDVGSARAEAAKNLVTALASAGAVAGDQAARIETTHATAEAMKVSKGAIWFAGAGGQPLPQPNVLVGLDGSPIEPGKKQ